MVSLFFPFFSSSFRFVTRSCFIFKYKNIIILSKKIIIQIYISKNNIIKSKTKTNKR